MTTAGATIGKTTRMMVGAKRMTAGKKTRRIGKRIRSGETTRKLDGRTTRRTIGRKKRVGTRRRSGEATRRMIGEATRRTLGTRSEARTMIGVMSGKGSRQRRMSGAPGKMSGVEAKRIGTLGRRTKRIGTLARTTKRIGTLERTTRTGKAGRKMIGMGRRSGRKTSGRVERRINGEARRVGKRMNGQGGRMSGEAVAAALVAGQIPKARRRIVGTKSPKTSGQRRSGIRTKRTMRGGSPIGVARTRDGIINKMTSGIAGNSKRQAIMIIAGMTERRIRE
mmetsp:Transcript_48319/g.113079  ORF Transcript_48319/g.113079 Transcript_48319/m.113079 type:complete len:280 (+) Transcript_48319:347-1186(+)